MQRIKEARELGVIAAIVVIVFVLYTIFASPAFSCISDGSYLNSMDLLNLTMLEGDSLNNVVESFRLQRFDYSEIFRPGQSSMILPASIARLIAQVTGQLFHTQILAIVYTLIIGFGVYMLTSGIARHTCFGAAVAALAMVVLLSNNMITAYLNSLYELGAVIAFTVLMLGCVVHAFSLQKGCGTRYGMAVILSCLLFIRSQMQMITFAPYALIVSLMAVWHTSPRGKQWGLHALICILAIFFCAQGVVAGFAANPDAVSDANNYLSVFQGYLPSAEDPTVVLDTLGLDESYLQDIGRSYYENASVFVHAPTDPAEQKALLDKITLPARVRYCVQNPHVIGSILESRADQLHSADNWRVVTQQGATGYYRLPVHALIAMFTGDGGLFRLTLWMGLAALFSLLLIGIAPHHSGVRMLSFGLAALFASMMLYLPLDAVVTGAVEIYKSKVVYFLMGWVALGAIGTMVCILVQRLMLWLSQQHTPLRSDMTRVNTMKEMLWFDRLHMSRGALVSISAIVCVALCSWLMLSESHVGGVNNGDYGRMMDQLELNWNDEMSQRFDETAGIYVIEEYNYRDEFHPERLTPADPHYSLIYPAAVVRLWSGLTGERFNTQVLAVVMLAMTVAAVLLIIHDMYAVLGRATVLLAIGLITMMFGENYVAWYNALFGESSVSTGIIMTIACALHLCIMKRGAKSSWIWLALLAFSVRFMTCSKAQMALSLPGGLLLIVALSWYHHPKGIMRCIALGVFVVFLSGWVGMDTLGVYQKNQGVSERQTIWQSVFYGALMIADDPDAAMEELGIPPEMKADIGKHAYYPEEDYVYPVMSDKAQEVFYDHVTTMTMVKYYLRHPADLWYMLNHAAGESVQLHTGFMCYTDETYDEREGLYRFNIWSQIRPLTACNAFWQYIVVYGLVLGYCLKVIFNSKTVAQKRMFALLFVSVMCIGVLQYPLTVVGNGFADNNKQLYAFMLCHDLMVLFGLVVIVRHFAIKAREGLAISLKRREGM